MSSLTRRAKVSVLSLFLCCFFCVWNLFTRVCATFAARDGKQILRFFFCLNWKLLLYNFAPHGFILFFQNYFSRLEVTYANNNTLIKKFENMPNIERPTSSPSPAASTETSGEEKSTTTKKKANGIRKVFSERSKSLISSGGGKQKINTDAYF